MAKCKLVCYAKEKFQSCLRVITDFCSGFVTGKEEVSAATDIPMEGFFDGADIIAEAMASAMVAATREVLAEALVPLSRPIFAEEGVFIRGKVIGESAPFFA